MRLLGHPDIKTTERYVHVATVDDMAACVMLGAAIEGALVAMAELEDLQADIEKASSAVRDRNGVLVPPDECSFGQLLALANELEWLPARLLPDEHVDMDEALERGDIGDFVEYVRELRNLVHPGKYVREYPDVSIEEDHYADCYAVFELVMKRLISLLMMED